LCISHFNNHITRFLILASRFSNFVWDKLGKYDLVLTIMDLVIAVSLCNCAIAIIVFAIFIWTIRFRRQLIRLTQCFDRWTIDWTLLSSDNPASLTQPLGTSIAASRAQIDYLRQIYQRQLLTVDRIRTLGLFIGVVRSLFIYRRSFKD
jgi:hypothetical protein